MSETVYNRVDIENPVEKSPGEPGSSASTVMYGDSPSRKVRFWYVLPLSLVLSVFQAVVTVLAGNYRDEGPTSTMIPVLSFGMLFMLVLLFNPLARFLWKGPLTRAELMCIFSAMLVTSGISTYGLADQLVPIIASPWNPEWNTPQAGWQDQLLPNLNKNLYITDAQAVRTFREGLGLPQPPETASLDAKWTYYGQVLVNVPWGLWLKPLFFWMIFIAACYGLFYSLSYLVLGYWGNREKLIFPLAKLPEAFIPEADEHKNWVPRIFKSSGFWIGFAISFLVISWNAAQASDTISGLGRIALGKSADSVELMLKDSFLVGLAGNRWSSYPLAFLIIFTAIGIAFLLPLEISFSAWFYFLTAKVILLIAIWEGYGKTVDDFPSDWIWSNNPVSAQGAGGMLLFSGIALFRSIKQYFAYASGKSGVERLLLMKPVIGLGICLIIITGWMYWNNFGLILSIAIVSFLTLITLGLMRIVAEGGIYWFQSHASFFHVFKVFGLGKVFSPMLLGPLVPIYSTLFLDIKTFMAPNLLNATKMQEDTGASRSKFHWNLVLSIVATVAVSLGLAIFLCYMRGAQQMNSWFYSGGPRSVVDTAYNVATSPAKFETTTAVWYAVGAVWVAVTMYVRQTLFWFPHPIGYIMLINPLMSRLWFSFFIGWVAKKFVVKYGGKATFDRVRYIFIGLIMGELMAIFLWSIWSLWFDKPIPGIDLNRYDS
jgi:hypothetical protein